MIAEVHLVALLISIYFPPESGGGATGAWNRALTLAKLGFRVFVLTGFPSYPSGNVAGDSYRWKFIRIEKTDRMTIIRIRLLPLAHEGYLKRFILFSNFVISSIVCLPYVLYVTKRLDLVYARSPVLFSSLCGYLYSKAARSRYVYEVPDLWPEELVAFPIRFSRYIMKIGVRLASWSFRLPNAIITIGSLAAELINTNYKPKPPVYGVPVGVDTDRFVPLSKTDSRMNLISDGTFLPSLESKFILLYSGIISEAQKVEMLAEASEKLIQCGNKKIAILILGAGPTRKNIERAKIEKKLENLYLLPIQPRNKMAAIISACDCCAVMLSPEPIFQIALPTKFYEYLACRKPIIGISSGELASVIQQKEIGYVITPGETNDLVNLLKNLADSPTSLNMLNKNIELALQDYSIEGISVKLGPILQNLLKFYYKGTL